MLKSLIVAAPAGSGKTEELSKRYIELLKNGVEPQRILTLTFTDKAAAEMKDRILKRLREKPEYGELYRKVRENILRLRISTIHSFCLGLLRRFAPHVGLDPALEPLDEAGSDELWNQALYETLASIAADPDTEDYRTLMDLVAAKKKQAWDDLTKLFATLYKKRVAVERARVEPTAEDDYHALRAELLASQIGPGKIPNYPGLFPKELSADTVDSILARLDENRLAFCNQGGGPIRRGKDKKLVAWNEQMYRYYNTLKSIKDYAEFGRILDLFQRRFLAAYEHRKQEAGAVDFVDMEYRALQIISEDDQWQNILRAFDEETDHLLVDEFQDTSYLQWAIIDKLTEEWRAGRGAKAEKGVEPTIFIVGDVKQSIYFFRDAKVEVFSAVENDLRANLGKRLEKKTIEYNYRSLQAIVDFTNVLFSRLMSQTGQTSQTSTPWRTPYEPFKRGRKNDKPGRVEILLDRSDGNMDVRRPLEAEMVCRRINSLVAGPEPLTIYERQSKPELPEIPRVCGYGDIAILVRTNKHLHFLIDALNRHRIPFVAVGGEGFYSEPEVCHVKSLLAFLADPADNNALYALLRGPLFLLPERDILLANAEPGSSLWERLQAYAQRNPEITSVAAALRSWLGRVNYDNLSTIIEHVLTERRAWTYFWEEQRVANIRKFLRIVEQFELEGRHPLRIAEYFEAAPEEKRADVSVETGKAVQIMTVHKAKGLQFPVVFYTECDNSLANRNDRPLFIEERGPTEAWASYITDAGARKENRFWSEYFEKEAEEEKRVFYVACTRATDALFLTGVWGKHGSSSTLSWLEEHLGLAETKDGFCLTEKIPGVYCLTAQDIPAANPPKPEKKTRPKSFIGQLSPEPPPSTRAVTRNLAIDFKEFGEEAVGTGEILHKVLEAISKGRLTTEVPQLTAEIQRLLRLDGLDPSLHSSILSTVQDLERNESIWNIVKPQARSEAELPAMYCDESGTVWTARIDRVIVTEDEVRIYDYKTYSVEKKEIPRLAREYYEGQLRYYAEACRKLYPGKKVRTFLIFTALPQVVETGLPDA
ncbi:MAG: UvrD-helicase domain-containing protein [candidate division WOR-3 bacterium]